MFRKTFLREKKPTPGELYEQQYQAKMEAERGSAGYRTGNPSVLAFGSGPTPLLGHSHITLSGPEIPYHTEVFRLSDGELVIQIGCQIMTLSAWDQNLEGLLEPFSPSRAAQLRRMFRAMVVFAQEALAPPAPDVEKEEEEEEGVEANEPEPGDQVRIQLVEHYDTIGMAGHLDLDRDGQ